MTATRKKRYTPEQITRTLTKVRVARRRGKTLQTLLNDPTHSDDDRGVTALLKKPSADGGVVVIERLKYHAAGQDGWAV
jgi:hypothetical protein